MKPKGDITKFSKDFWRTVVAYGGADEKILRNHDILQARKDGMSYQQLANKFQMSKMQIIRICTKDR